MLVWMNGGQDKPAAVTSGGGVLIPPGTAAGNPGPTAGSAGKP